MTILKDFEGTHRGESDVRATYTCLYIRGTAFVGVDVASMSIRGD